MFYGSASFPTFTFWKKPSAFIGLSVGVNAATSQEAVQNNRQFGGGYVDGVGGGAGASGYEGRNGLGPIRPYGYVTVGEGWQIGGGVVYSHEFFGS
jgi:hypothetical protein